MSTKSLCSNCKYWWPIAPEPPDSGPVKGLCRAHAPSFVESFPDVGQWPMTLPKMWCGEWLAKYPETRK